MSETPFWFLVIISLCLISIAFKKKTYILYLSAGITLTIAAGFRYEAWLIIPLFAFVIVVRDQWKKSLVFIAIASIFPMLWIFYSLQHYGTLFHPEAPVFSAVMNTSEFDWESWARKGWYYPLSIILSTGPVTCYFIFKYLKKKISGNALIWILVPIVLLLVLIYKSFTGSILLQHRFTGLSTLFLIPFFSYYASEKFPGKRIVFILVMVTSFGLSFIYNTGGIAGIPRLKDKRAAEIAEVIRKNVSDETELIIDFDGWENTWYYAYESGLRPEKILINYQNDDLDGFLKESAIIINRNWSCIIVLKKGSEAEKYFREIFFREEVEFRNVYEYGSTEVILLAQRFFNQPIM